MSRMRTFTGHMVNPCLIRPTDLRIADIAHSLAYTNRFFGHLPAPVNVARHSLIVEKQIRYITSDPVARLWALMHDAHEAYLGDVIRPLLHEMPQEVSDWLHELRDDTDRVIQTWLGIRTRLSPPTLRHILEVDREACYWEGILAFGADVTDNDWFGYKPSWPCTLQDLQCDHPEDDEEIFLAHFDQYQKELSTDGLLP